MRDGESKLSKSVALFGVQPEEISKPTVRAKWSGDGMLMWLRDSNRENFTRGRCLQQAAAFERNPSYIAPEASSSYLHPTLNLRLDHLSKVIPPHS